MKLQYSTVVLPDGTEVRVQYYYTPETRGDRWGLGSEAEVEIVATDPEVDDEGAEAVVAELLAEHAGYAYARIGDEGPADWELPSVTKGDY